MFCGKIWKNIKKEHQMNDVKIELILPNRNEDKDDIAYIISRIIEKSGIDNFIGETSYDD